MSLTETIKPMSSASVRCEADRCEAPALFLFVAAGMSGGVWAYCEEHTRLRAVQAKVQLPREVGATAGAC